MLSIPPEEDRRKNARTTRWRLAKKLLDTRAQLRKMAQRFEQEVGHATLLAARFGSLGAPVFVDMGRLVRLAQRYRTMRLRAAHSWHEAGRGARGNGGGPAGRGCVRRPALTGRCCSSLLNRLVRRMIATARAADLPISSLSQRVWLAHDQRRALRSFGPPELGVRRLSGSTVGKNSFLARLDALPNFFLPRVSHAADVCATAESP